MTKEETDKYLDSLRTALYRAEAITQAMGDELINRQAEPGDVDCTCLADSANDYIRQSLTVIDEIEFAKCDENRQAKTGAGGD